MTSAGTYRQALVEATKRGMRIRQSPDDRSRCYVSCPKCNWPGEPPDWTCIVERYVETPHGCPMCALERENAPGAATQQRGR